MAVQNTSLYYPLPERHIRLLSIIPFQHPPSGTLNVVSLDDDPVFDALSCAWGDSGDLLDFLCSGQVLRVRENLGDFLRQIKEERRRPIWTDAICINQDDDIEKKHQIPLMGEVYGKATQVLVWLGTNSKAEDKALAMIPILADSICNRPSYEKLQGYYPDPSSLGIPLWRSSIWGDIRALFCRPWFNRLWILQDVQCARQIYLFCGRERTAWEKIVTFICEFGGHSLRVTLLTRGPSSPREIHLGFKSVMLLEMLRNELLELDSNDSALYKMSRVLSSIRERIATRRADKVYGSLSVMPSDVQRAITVDVSMSQAQVFAIFAKSLLGHGDASLILGHASHSFGSESLPSWCPNLDEAPVGNPFSSFFLPDGFAAGYERTTSGKERIHFLQEWNMIEVTGMLMLFWRWWAWILICPHFEFQLWKTLSLR